MSSYYMRQGYALVHKKGSVTGHWFGGENHHEGADCPICKIPLLLIADIDCTQLRANADGKIFSAMDRLPLYYCWRCCAERLTYRVLNPKSVHVLGGTGEYQGDDYPYPDFPASFPRHEVSLVPIPYDLAKLLALWQEVDEYWLFEDDKKTIMGSIGHLRHSHFCECDVNRHQLGGIPALVQGHEYVRCSNPACQKRMPHSNELVGPQMKELAVFCNDPVSGLPMAETLESLEKPSSFNEWVQLVYWVCEECHAITVSNRVE